MSNSIIPANDQNNVDIDLSKLTRENMEASIRGILDNLRDTNDMRRATKTLQALEKFQDLSGFGRAQLLHGMKAWADENGKDFYKNAGLTARHQQTYADRLIDLWDNIEQKKFPKSFLKRPLRDIMPVSMHLAQGHDLDEDEWIDLNGCTDTYQIQEKLREFLKKPPRKGTMELRLNEKGTITIWVNGTPHFGGFLNIEGENTDEVIKKFVKRAVDTLHIKREIKE